MVVFSHSPLNGDKDQPCHTVPPYSRYSMSDSLGLYQRDFPADTRMLSLSEEFKGHHPVFITVCMQVFPFLIKIMQE